MGKEGRDEGGRVRRKGGCGRIQGKGMEEGEGWKDRRKDRGRVGEKR